MRVKLRLFTDVRTRGRLRGATMVTAIIASMAVIVPNAQAGTGGYHYDGKVWPADPVQTQPVVQGHAATSGTKPPRARTPMGARALVTHHASAPEWPVASTGTVSLARGTSTTAARAGASPVSVAPVATRGASRTRSTGRAADASLTPSSVRVRVAGHEQAQALGAGILVGLTRGDGRRAAGRVDVKIDYSAVADAYGGGWASRLRLVALPGCALSTPSLAACRTRTPLATANDAAAQTLTAAVDLPATPTATTSTESAGRTDADGTREQSAAAPMTVAVAVVSGANGSQGDYSATSLSASGSWSQSATGAFTYSYPIAVPASLGGSAPSVALSYDSQSVDGETSARNSQASWIGDGWSYAPGFIERSYRSCGQDGIDHSDDECWAGYNATLSLGSHNGQLVRDSSGIYHLQSDDGTRVERLTGASNGLWQGEYYKVTTTDGTAYYFGVDHTPGTTADASTNSAWGLPVYHPKASDPCHTSAKGDDSQCDQPVGYRFNLDFVVDPHGNVQRYDYATETGYYNMGLGQVAASGGGGTITPYVRGGYLTEISYGYQLDDARAQRDPAARVLFTTTQRCVTSDTVCQASNLSDSTATNWPDVPYDIHCDPGDKTSGDGDDVCHSASPSYWSTYRLQKITTQIRTSNGFRSVDSYALTQVFSDAGGVIDPVTGKDGEDKPDAGQLQAVMWLSQIQHTGLDTAAGGAGPLTLDPVTFTGVESNNRVDGLTPGAPPLYRPRIASIQTETGESIAVTYATPQCSRVNGTMPASADSNAMVCFPVYWYPPGAVDPISDWFNKSLIVQVSDSDSTLTGSPTKVTSYAYDHPAWHRDDSDLTDDEYRTWNDFRGFRQVTTETGTASDRQTKSVTTYLQGMDGDRKADGSTRSVTVGGVTDSNWLAGMPLETDSFDTTVSADVPVTRSINDAPATVSTATSTRTAWTSEDPAPAQLSTLPDLESRRIQSASATTTSKTKAGSRTTQTLTGYDAYGRVTKVDAKGDTSVPSQETCTTTSYAPAPSGNPMMLAYPSETIEVAGPCGTAPGTATTLMDKRVYYDGDGSISDLGTYGKLGQSWPEDGSTPKVHSLGQMTAVQTIKSYDTSGNPSFVTTGALTYDEYGRVIKSLDGAGAETDTSYSPAGPTLPTSVTTTNPLGWTSTTAVDPARGAVTEATDANGRLTDSTFDALGRRTAAWLPGRSKADNPDSPDRKFTYGVHGTGSGGQVVPASVTTQTLREDGSYDTSVSIYDGMLQLRQTQATPADASDGRLVTSYRYDSHGWLVATINTYSDPGNPPSSTFFAELENSALSETKTVHDGLGRATENQTWAQGNLLWKTTTSYPGVDETDTTPPAGGQPTSTVTDALGRTTATSILDRTPDSRLNAGTVITSGSSYASNSVRLTMQADGNLVLRGIASGAQLWASATSGNPGATATVRSDGGLVVTSTAGAVLWDSKSEVSGATGGYLVVGDDASVQMRNAAGASKWTSGTAGKAQPADTTTRYTYTPAGQTSTVTDAVGNSWSYRYNLEGELVSQHDPDAGDSTYGYDDYGHLVQTTDPRGQVLSYTYDVLGRKTAEYAEAAPSDPTDHHPAAELASWAYDTLARDPADTDDPPEVDRGMPASTTRYVGGANGSAYVERIDGYDTAYRPTGTTTVIPDAEGALAGTYTSKATYKPVTGLLADTTYDADGGLPAETVGYAYNLQGLLTQTGSDGNPYLDAALHTPLGQIQQSTYGVYGKQLRTKQTYDAATQRLQTSTVEVMPGTASPVDDIAYGYDQAGNLDAVSDTQSSGGTVSGVDTQCYQYDGMGRLAQAWSDKQGMTTPAVSGRGQVAHCTTAIPTSATVGGPAPYWQSYTYDLLGDRTQQVKHDVGGNPLKDVTQSVAYASTTAPAGLPDQATSVTTSSPARGTATSTLNYQDTSHVTSGVNAGSVTSRDSTASGELVSGIKSTSGGDMCLADPKADTTDGTPQIIYTCGYGGQTYTLGTDGTVKILGKCLDTKTDTSISNYPLVVINTCSAAKPSQMWRATAAGNLVNVASKLCLADPAANPANSTKQIMFACGHDAQTYTTPATGTSLTAGQTQTVAYDEEGRTRTVVTGDGLTPKKTDYLYDADGNLLIERDPGSTVLYLFAGAEQLTLTTSTAKVTGLRYYGNPDGTTIVRSSAGKLTYLPSDPQGTSQTEVDASTLAVTRRAYDPYGAPRGTAPTSWADNHGYLGQPTDPGSGLDLLGARDYDATLGRFLSVDPVFEPGDPSQMGGYAYAGDDPVNGSDPSGLMLSNKDGSDGFTPNDFQYWGYDSQQEMDAAAAKVKPYHPHTGWRHALDVAADAVELGGVGIVGDAGAETVGACRAAALVSPGCVNSARWLAGQVAGFFGGCVDTGCTDGEGTSGDTSTHGVDDPPATSARPEEDLITGSTPAEAAPQPPGNPDAGTPPEVARPSSPKSATAKKPVSDDTAPRQGSPEKSGEACSFSADTPVLLDHGDTKPIGDITVGDKVEAADPATGKEAGSRAVTATWVNYDSDLVDVTIKGADGKTATLHTTSKHPFWDDTTHTWMPAGSLHAGDALNTDKNTHVTVLAVHTTPGAANRWNLTVAQLHTYYVLAGTTPILVHNVDLGALNSCPTAATTHTAQVTVHDSDGKILHDYDIRSGAQTPAEQAMGRGGETLSHTENRAARMAGGVPSYGTRIIYDDEFFGDMPVPLDGYVIINGTRPPCSSCMGAMTRGAQDTGSTFVYIWEEAGRPVWWSTSG